MTPYLCNLLLTYNIAPTCLLSNGYMRDIVLDFCKYQSNIFLCTPSAELRGVEKIAMSRCASYTTWWMYPIHGNTCMVIDLWVNLWLRLTRGHRITVTSCKYMATKSVIDSKTQTKNNNKNTHTHLIMFMTDYAAKKYYSTLIEKIMRLKLVCLVIKINMRALHRNYKLQRSGNKKRY